MPILILGAGGFLGQHLARHFSAAGHVIIGVDHVPMGGVDEAVRLTLPDPALAQLIRQRQPQAVLFAAGRAQVGLSVELPLLDFEQSVVVWANTLEAVRLSGVACNTIFLSSAAIYGNPARLPITETDPIAPISPYGYHKMMCETLAEYYAQLYDLPIAILRVFSAYGEGLRRQVLWDICRKALKEPVIHLSGDGEETRDFIHAADIARAVECVLQYGASRATRYNIANGTSVTIRGVAETLMSGLGLSKPIHFSGEQRPGDPRHWQADITALRALGFRAQIAFADGARAYAQWASTQHG